MAGLIGTSLNIGRSALLSYQSALQVVGQNVANAGTDNYTRQSPQLAAMRGVPLPDGSIPGGGVTLASLQRHVDESLENRLRTAVGDRASAEIQQDVLRRIESQYNELTDDDLSTRLSEFFAAWSDLQNRPEDLSARGVVVTTGEALAGSIRKVRQDLGDLRVEVDDRLARLVERANELSETIAALNQEITDAESGGSSASALRDQRDLALRQLSEIIELQVRADGSAVNVFVANEPLVLYSDSRGLLADRLTDDGAQDTVIRFADNGGQVTVVGGQAQGLIVSRDGHVDGQIDRLDTLAGALIEEVNRVHAAGQGLEGFEALTGLNDVLDETVALSDAEQTGLAATVVNGSFQVRVHNEAAGTSQTHLIEVDLDGIGADTTLATLAAAIDAASADLTATVTGDKRLSIVANNGFSFTFAEDTSGALGALGMNAYFTGRDARDIGINAMLKTTPTRVAAATQNLPADGSNAGNLAQVGGTGATRLGGLSLTDYYDATIGQLAVDTSAARSGFEAADVLYGALSAQRESVSGVSLDEETVSLMRYQRAFQGAARYITVVDELVQEMLNIAR